MNMEGRMIIRRCEEIDKCRDETVSPGVGEEDLTRNAKDEQQSLCWNFPRVKLRRLFNAKSLDDILGRTGRKGTQSSESSNSIHNNLRPNAHSHTNLSRDSQSYSNAKISPLTPQGLSGSSSENNCFAKDLPGVTPTFVRTAPDKGNKASQSNVPKSTVKSNLSVDKLNSSRVKGAKSDNCLHLIVSATSLCTKIASSSVDNLDSERGEKASDGFVLKLPVPVSVQVKQIEEREQRRRRSRKIVKETEQRETVVAERIPQSRKKSQVSPEQGLDISVRTESENILPKLTSSFDGVLASSEIDNETAMMTKEKAKLVVANVGYLQRPLSPTPAPNFGATQSFNNNVFKTSGFSPASGRNRNFITTMPDNPRNTQWLPSNGKCANSSYSYNNYNNQNQYAAGTFGSAGSGRPLESSNRANNESANAFKISKPDHLSSYSSQLRHGQNDNFPSHFSDTAQINTAGMRNAGVGIGRDTGGRGVRLRPTSPALHHPEQINNNYAIMISPGQTGTHAHSSFPQEHHYQQQQQQNRCDNTPVGRRGYANTRPTPRSVEAGIILNQDISADTETTEGMGDLQSPQYVKRTAHMFDSRYTAQVNGSSADSRRNADGTSQRVTSQHNQPSYLSVSRSVCGYSCLSYNNGTTTTTSAMTSTTNGVSPTPYKPIPSRLSGVKSDFPISYRQTSNGHPVDSNGRENETIGKTETLDMENNQNDVGNYGQSRAKSNILEKIERLYGTNAVTTASLWRRPVPLLQMPSDPSSRTSTAFKTINENVGNGTSRRGEKIIPIFLESSRKQLSRIDSADGDYEDDHHIVKVPSSMTAKVPNRDKVSDKLSDDLYSKHDILNSNRLQKHTNGHNGTSITPLQANLSTNSVRDDSTGLSSRKSLDEQGSIPIAVSNLNSETKITPQILSTDKTHKDDEKVFETVRMGKDLFHANTDEQISLAPAQLQEKTEDSIDGESKQIFRVVSNLSSREEPEDMGWKTSGSLNISGSPPKLPVTLRSTEECSDDVMKENIFAGNKVEEKNGEYFLEVLQKEKSYIASLIKTAERRLETLDTSEDSPDFEFSGVVLAAIGKANLLINKKFKQFEGLCNDNIEQREKGVVDEPFTTKNEDLEGFWDMVLIQVEQIHSMFKDLEKGGNVPPTMPSSPKKNESKKASTQKLSSAASKTTAASKSKSSGNTARDESRRKMLAERRKAMKNQLEAQSANTQQTSEPEVQIFVHDTASES